MELTYHGDTAPNSTSYGDDIQVNGHYWTVGFLDSLTGGSNVSNIEASYNSPSNNPGNVTDRHGVYLAMNDAIKSPDAHYHTHFFAGAADVTGLTSLGGAETMSANDFYIYPFSQSSVQALEQIGADLYKYVNAPAFNALYSGNDNFVLHVERSDGSFAAVRLGDVAAKGESAIDAALVMNEQYNVQIELNHLSPSVRDALAGQSSSVISSFANGATNAAVQNLGHQINFANIDDRIKLGYYTVAYAAANGE